ncbi:MAG: GGDEF domain-containing protein [Pirellulales bacterium]|nr:GGDEF domain-containing protein [Pirellulales bacterium]
MLAGILAAPGLLTDTAALGAVALVAYILGRRRRSTPPDDAPLRMELARAQDVAQSLERIARRLHLETAGQLRSTAAFQRRVRQMQQGAAAASWQTLRDQADALLGPTMKLTTTLSLACDELRVQQAQLTSYAGARTDAATGLRNRRAMSEQLAALLTAHAAGRRRLALAMFSPPLPDDQADGACDDYLKAVGRLMEQTVRGLDVVARYSGDEFVVLMPKTPLAGALVFAERLVRQFDEQFRRPLWGGVVEALPDETPDKLLRRAYSALYSARTHDEACIFQHNGAVVRRHQFQLHPAADADLDLYCTALA